MDVYFLSFFKSICNRSLDWGFRVAMEGNKMGEIRPLLHVENPMSSSKPLQQPCLNQIQTLYRSVHGWTVHKVTRMTTVMQSGRILQLLLSNLQGVLSDREKIIVHHILFPNCLPHGATHPTNALLPLCCCCQLAIYCLRFCLLMWPSQDVQILDVMRGVALCRWAWAAATPLPRVTGYPTSCSANSTPARAPSSCSCKATQWMLITITLRKPLN